MKRFLVVESDDEMHAVFVWRHEGDAHFLRCDSDPGNFIHAIPLGDSVDCPLREDVATYITDNLLPYKGGKVEVVEQAYRQKEEKHED